MTSDQSPPLTHMATHATGSFELVLGPVLMALLGLLVDSWLGTRPVFILTLTVWGALGAGVSIWVRYRRRMAFAITPESSGPEGTS